MRKPNLIIGKKQIILASLTLVLGIAVYMNYVFAEVGNDIAADAEIQSAADTQVNYGDAAFVGADSSDPAEPVSAGASDYFAQARLSRMTSRDDAVQTLSAILGGGDLTEEENAAYTMEAVNLSQLSESESKVESLIRAQGFEDCVVFLQNGECNVVVKVKESDPNNAVVIKDIVAGQAGVSYDKIKIVENQ